MQKWPAQNGQKKRATCFETLLQNEWNNDVARLTTLESNLSCNKSGCEKLLLNEEGICTCCAFYWPKANLLCNKWRNTRFWRDSRVILSNQKSVFTQLTTTWVVPRKGWPMVVKRAALLFHSFCSNVSKQAARFCWPLYWSFTRDTTACNIMNVFVKESRARPLIRQPAVPRFSSIGCTRTKWAARTPDARNEGISLRRENRNSALACGKDKGVHTNYAKSKTRDARGHKPQKRKSEFRPRMRQRHRSAHLPPE